MTSRRIVDSVTIDEFTEFLVEFISRPNITAEQESLARMTLSSLSFLGSMISSDIPVECSHAYFNGMCMICLEKEDHNADIGSTEKSL